jgi:hypothetical protein
MSDIYATTDDGDAYFVVDWQFLDSDSQNHSF